MFRIHCFCESSQAPRAGHSEYRIVWIRRRTETLVHVCLPLQRAPCHSVREGLTHNRQGPATSGRARCPQVEAMVVLGSPFLWPPHLAAPDYTPPWFGRPASFKYPSAVCFAPGNPASCKGLMVHTKAQKTLGKAPHAEDQALCLPWAAY